MERILAIVSVGRRFTPKTRAFARVLPYVRSTALGIVLVLLSSCLLVPIGVGLLISVWSGPLDAGGHLSFANYVSALEDPATLHLIGNTAILTAGAAGIATALGILLAWIVALTDVPAPRLLSFMCVAPALLPGLLKDTAWITLYSPRSGLVNIELERLLHFGAPVFDIYGMLGMIVDTAFSITPIIFFIMFAAFSTVSRDLDEASRVSGARRLQTTLRILLPAIRPAVFSAVALSAILVAASFQTPILLGLPVGILTFTSAIYGAIQNLLPPNYNLAAVYSSLYLVVTLALLVWYMSSTRAERRFALITGRGNSRSRIRVGSWRWVLLGVVLVYFVLAFVQLVGVTVLVSVLPYYTAATPHVFHSFTLTYYRQLLTTPSLFKAVLTSIVFSGVVALLTTGIAVLLALVAYKSRIRFRRFFDLIGTLPIGIPPVVFSVFLLISILSIPGLVVIYNSIIPLVVVSVIIFLPFAVRTVAGSVVQVHDEIIEASRISGATWLRTLRRVTLPVLRGALMSSFVLVFALCFVELGGIILLIGPNTVLLPAVIFDQWNTGYVGVATALNVVSVVVSGLVLAIGATAVKLRPQWYARSQPSQRGDAR